MSYEVEQAQARNSHAIEVILGSMGKQQQEEHEENYTGTNSTVTTAPYDLIFAQTQEVYQIDESSLNSISFGVDESLRTDSVREEKEKDDDEECGTTTTTTTTELPVLQQQTPLTPRFKTAAEMQWFMSWIPKRFLLPCYRQFRDKIVTMTMHYWAIIPAIVVLDEPYPHLRDE